MLYHSPGPWHIKHEPTKEPAIILCVVMVIGVLGKNPLSSVGFGVIVDVIGGRVAVVPTMVVTDPGSVTVTGGMVVVEPGSVMVDPGIVAPGDVIVTVRVVPGRVTPGSVTVLPVQPTKMSTNARIDTNSTMRDFVFIFVFPPYFKLVYLTIYRMICRQILRSYKIESQIVKNILHLKN